jgi:thiamine pyrophosphokinase
MNILIFANGDILDGPMVLRALDSSHNPTIIAADGGARIAKHYDLPVHIVIGDMDSLTSSELDTLAQEGAEFQHHPPEKDYTDLELALYHACKLGADWVRIIGAIGGRFDQTMANVYLLALPIIADCDVRMVAGKQEIYILRPGTHQITGAPGDTISLIPLGGIVAGIYTQDLHYPLKDETLEFGPARGISNVLTNDTASITTKTGTLLIIHTVGRA